MLKCHCMPNHQGDPQRASVRRIAAGGVAVEYEKNTLDQRPTRAGGGGMQGMFSPLNSEHTPPNSRWTTPVKDVVFEDVCSRPRRTSFSPNISARRSSRIEKPR